LETDIPAGARKPHPREAVVPLLSLRGGIVSGVVALRCGCSWSVIQNGMVQGIANALPAMVILPVAGL